MRKRFIGKMRLKKTKKQILEEWMQMDISQKSRWNGYHGYCKKEKYGETSLFRNKKRKRR